MSAACGDEAVTVADLSLWGPAVTSPVDVAQLMQQLCIIIFILIRCSVGITQVVAACAGCS